MANTPFSTKAETEQKIQEAYQELDGKIEGIASGYRGTIAISDFPTEDGIYTPTEAGTYINAGGLVYAPETIDKGFDVKFLKTGSEWVKNVVYVGVEAPSLEDLSLTKDIQGNIVTGSYWRNGTIIAGASYVRTEKIPIHNPDDIYIQSDGRGSTAQYLFFDSDENFIPRAGFTSDLTTLTKVNIPEGSAFVAASGRVGGIDIIIQRRFISYREIATKDEIPDLNEYGITEKNIDYTVDKFYYNRETGMLVSSNNFETTGIQPLNKDDIFYKGILGNASGESVVFFDENQDYLSPYYSYENKTDWFKITSPLGAKYYSVSHQKTNPTLEVKTVGKILGLLDTKSNSEDSDLNKYFNFGEDSEQIREVASADPSNYALLLMGQSNAGPHAAFSDLATFGLPTSLDANKFNGTSFVSPMTLSSPTMWGIDWPLLHSLKEYREEEVLFHLNYQGATSITTDWDADKALQDESTRLSKYITDQPLMLSDRADLKFRCCVWIQGEADRVSPNNVEYYWRLKNLIAFVRGVNKNPYLPFVVVGMHPEQAQYSPIVRDSQMRAVSETENTYFVDPSGLTWSHIGDNNHYDGAYTVAISNLVFDVIKDF